MPIAAPRSTSEAAQVLRELWRRPVTQFAVAAFALLQVDPLPIERRGALDRAKLEAWARRQIEARPALLAAASRRRPRGTLGTDHAVRELRAALEASGARVPVAATARPASPSLAAAAPPLSSEARDVKAHGVTAIEGPRARPAAEKALSGLQALVEYLETRRPAALDTVDKWTRRPVDPLPVTRYGRGAKIVALPSQVDAWLEREQRRAARRERLAG